MENETSSPPRSKPFKELLSSTKRERLTPPRMSLFTAIVNFIKIAFVKPFPSEADLLLNLAEKYGLCFKLPGIQRTFIVSDPAYVQHILQGDQNIYSKMEHGYRRLSLVFGNGLLTTSDPETWREHRRLMQAHFHHQALGKLAEYSQQFTLEMFKKWDNCQRKSQPINLGHEMLKLSLKITLKTLLSEDLNERETDRMARDFKAGCRYINLLIHPKLPTLSNLKFYLLRRRLNNYAHEVVEKRRREKNPPDDLLTLLVTNGLTQHEMIDEVKTFIGTGHETTGNALTWTLFCLSKNPAIRERLIADCQRVLGGRLPEFSDLENLTYLQKVFNESMRLYPPIWSIGRQLKEADNIGPYHFSAGSTVIISPYVIHRHSALWDNPTQFDPERFTPERQKNRHKYAYIPFGTGPRVCIGSAFATIQAKIILPMILQRYELELLPESSDPLLATYVTLKPRKPVRVSLSLREAISE